MFDDPECRVAETRSSQPLINGEANFHAEETPHFNYHNIITFSERGKNNSKY